MKKLYILSAAVVGLALTGAAFADATTDAAIKARKAHMQLMAFHLAPLGGMAKGEIPYDAALAGAEAASLVAIASVDWSRYWPDGSDDMSADNTRALPGIWENMPDVTAKIAALGEATAAMQLAAGTDLEALRAAMGQLGGACGACHKVYRAPE